MSRRKRSFFNVYKNLARGIFGLSKKETLTSTNYLILAITSIGLILVGRGIVQNLSMFLILVACIFCGIVAWRRYKAKNDWHNICAIDLATIDRMTGHEFERYIGKLLAQQGYRSQVTKGSGDNGVDIIAELNGVRWAVQCKRQVNNVSPDAIRDVVAATQSTLFNCSRSMVVTNNYFSKAAIQYAKSTDCVLIDRNDLSQWIGLQKRVSAV
jgi:HJR/Mrr/RecB family endonuclease